MSLLLLFGGATPTVTGTVAVTLANTTSAASGTSAQTGTVAVTLGNATSTAAGTVGDTGTLAVTLANVTSSAAGGSGAAGTVAQTLGDVTSAAAGTSTPPGVAGSLAVTLDDVTCAASGTFTGTTPSEPVSGVGWRRPQFPPVPPTRGGRFVNANLVADLGTITAHLDASVEYADEEELLLLL